MGIERARSMHETPHEVLHGMMVSAHCTYSCSTRNFAPGEIGSNIGFEITATSL